MPKIAGAPKALNEQLEAAYSAALTKYKNEKKAAKIAWGAVKNAGWHKNAQGKWVKSKKQEMTEMLTKEIEIFAVGEYPQGKFTDKELEEIVSTYDPNVHEAPQVLGHLSSDSSAPAVGWVKALKKVGNKIIAIAQCGEELVKAVKDGLFKKRSVGLYHPDDPSNPTPGKWHLHHLAWLGAHPPQVKGLADVAFAQFEEDREENKRVEVEFADMSIEDVKEQANRDTYDTIELEFAQCLAKMQEYMESDEDDEAKRRKIELALSDCYSAIQNELHAHFTFLDKAESIIEKTKATLSEAVRRIRSTFSTHTNKETHDMPEDLRKQVEELTTQVAQFREAAERERQEKEALQASVRQKEQEQADARLRSDIAQFIETMRKEGRYTKRHDELKVPDIMFAVAKAGDIEFGEGKEKKPLIELFKEVLKSFGTTVELKELAKEDVQELGSVAKEVGGKYPVAESALRTVQLAEAYYMQHKAEFSEIPRKQALAQILMQAANGQIQLVPPAKN